MDQVQREETITCVGCKKNIRMVDKDKSVAKTVSKVNEAMDDLKKALEKLGPPIRLALVHARTQHQSERSSHPCIFADRIGNGI